ncbi:large ribosomal subunit protein mL41 [Tenebrio molitor]|jgi:large subunit ribosomal protein L41|uniref:large ribosomal subunit protein mL41 n=1 Tax=Tenebrio molitor TaxID=7067 RepID=UPI0036248789
MSFVNLFIKRGISTSCARYGKRNFRKFPIFNKRGSRIFKEQRKDPNYDLPPDKRGVRDVGYYVGNKFVLVPEMVPELVVPDLKDFELKPYVSYRTPDVIQSEFTAEDLFNVVYAPKIAKDFKEGKLREDGTPLEPSPEEKLTHEEAENKADQTGADLFCQ